MELCVMKLVWNIISSTHFLSCYIQLFIYHVKEYMVGYGHLNLWDTLLVVDNFHLFNNCFNMVIYRNNCCIQGSNIKGLKVKCCNHYVVHQSPYFWNIFLMSEIYVCLIVKYLQKTLPPNKAIHAKVLSVQKGLHYNVWMHFGAIIQTIWLYWARKGIKWNGIKILVTKLP